MPCICRDFPAVEDVGNLEIWNWKGKKKILHLFQLKGCTNWILSYAWMFLSVMLRIFLWIKRWNVWYNEAKPCWKMEHSTFNIVLYNLHIAFGILNSLGIWNQASEITRVCVTRVFFLTLLSRNFDDQLSSNLHRFVILCICWNTPNEKNGLWQLPNVSTVFNRMIAENVEFGYKHNYSKD